jgi:putative transposase
MIDRHHPQLSIARQCQLLALPRSTFYYQPQPMADTDRKLMRRLDELHLTHPFLGSRKLTLLLQAEGWAVGRRHVRRLMQRMGMTALYRKPNTSQPGPGHKIYPYLLRGMAIERSNQVWCTDITYLPMAQGFGYLVAVMDWHSRKVLSWRVSNTLTADFCVEALEEAIARFGTPAIFNTDQGSQFTSADFTDVLKAHQISISMDGRGRWVDNVFIERLWRSVKYEEIYLKAYASLAEARRELARYFSFYNQTRPHQSLADRTPDAVYFGALELRAAA